MPSFISHAPSLNSSPALSTDSPNSVQAPERLDLEGSRKQKLGNRLLGHLFRVALRAEATDLWIVAQEENILLMGKLAGNWTVLLNHHSFHTQAIIDALLKLSPGGLFTSESRGLASVWKLSSEPLPNGREVLLTAVA